MLGICSQPIDATVKAASEDDAQSALLPADVLKQVFLHGVDVISKDYPPLAVDKKMAGVVSAEEEVVD